MTPHTRSRTRSVRGSTQEESGSPAAPITPHTNASAHEDAPDSEESEMEGSEDHESEEEEEQAYLIEGESSEYEEAEEGEDDSEDDRGRGHTVSRIVQLISGSGQAQRFPTLPRGYVPPPLEHEELVAELGARSSASHPRHPVDVALPCKRKLLGTAVTNPTHQLLVREGGNDGRRGKLSAGQRAHFVSTHRLPSRPTRIADSMLSRGYIGQFTRDGDLFVAAFQNERRVKIYDVARGWRVLKNVHARGLRWTVTDTCLSADTKFLLYASITSTVHLVNVQRGHGEAEESIANVTDIHEPLEFAGDSGYCTGIWSLRWASDSTEIVAGTGDNSIYVYDVTAAKTTVRVEGHQDDVNAVAYADPSSCQVIFSGSDDCYVKVWDRRIMSGRRSKPQGVLVGHTEGITHIDSKGDGRYLISNGKDQTIKLWDLRRMRDPAEAQRLRRDPIPSFSWDYRWMEYPGRNRLVRHPHDGSLMTYRGHSVLSTLIRAYWSPAENTGQRYIYTGSADGGIYIYDVLTGRLASMLRYHREVVRDCSWHPRLPLLASVSFDGSICCWEPQAPGEVEMDAEEVEAKQAQRGDKATGAAKGRPRGANLPRPAGDQLGDYW